MHCAKCGREIPESEVFCGKCMDVMKLYPVKPGTTIQLPQRSPAPPKRSATRKKQLPPEELVVRQKSTIRRLTALLVCVALLLGLSVALLFELLPEEEATVTIGQNYITRDSVPQD